MPSVILDTNQSSDVFNREKVAMESPKQNYYQSLYEIAAKVKVSFKYEDGETDTVDLSPYP